MNNHRSLSNFYHSKFTFFSAVVFILFESFWIFSYLHRKAASILIKFTWHGNFNSNASHEFLFLLPMKDPKKSQWSVHQILWLKSHSPINKENFINGKGLTSPRHPNRSSTPFNILVLHCCISLHFLSVKQCSKISWPFISKKCTESVRMCPKSMLHLYITY